MKHFVELSNERILSVEEGDELLTISLCDHGAETNLCEVSGNGVIRYRGRDVDIAAEWIVKGLKSEDNHANA